MNVKKWREIVALSKRLDPRLQDPLRYQARCLGLEVAFSLVGEGGELAFEGIEETLLNCRANMFSEDEEEALLFQHVLSCLKVLQEDPSLQNVLNRLAPPLCHRGAGKLIRDTLWPLRVDKVGSRELKVAVLSAWFTWLRQITGSCFATAPAILIQSEHPRILLQDLLDLLSKGELSRVLEGQLFTVPLCPSHQFADLYRPLGGASMRSSPATLAAFGFAQMAVLEEEMEANCPAEWIEQAVAKALGLRREDFIGEEEREKSSMDLLLAKQTAVYYRPPTEKEKKWELWKEKTEKIKSAYQAFGECVLLRAWEYTIASFCDAKSDFVHWNLYVSLGLHPEEPNGVGAFLYREITKKLSVLQTEQEALQEEYDRNTRLIRTLELLFQQTASFERRHSLRTEWAQAELRANSALQRFQANEKEMEAVSNLFSSFVQTYNNEIPKWFQEIYDPALVVQNSLEQNDSPAGFRLCFKSGRASLWNFIRGQKEFITALCTLFSSVEREISGAPREVTALSTSLIQYIQTEEFLKGAFERALKNRKSERGEAKPWEYISGGNLQSLMSAYASRGAPFSAFERRIQEERELLLFLRDAQKEIEGQGALLIHSPTHAFIYRSDWMPADLSSALKEMEDFWRNVEVGDETVLIEKLAKGLPAEERALFLYQWRYEGAVGSLSRLRSLLPGKELLVDAFLYESLPLISIERARQLARTFSIDNFQSEEAYVTPTEFRKNLKRQLPPSRTSDLDFEIARVLRREGLAAPAPILFGDSNGSVGFLGLAISPHQALELWCFHRTAMRGFPMRTWFEEQKGGIWTILDKKHEYFAREMKF
jgi:hypothetical protein